MIRFFLKEIAKQVQLLMICNYFRANLKGVDY